MPEAPPGGLRVSDGAARLGILLAYFFNGAALSSWMVRLPALRDQLALAPADIGVFLTAGAVGTLVTVTLAGAAVMRWGPRAVYHLATGGFLLAYSAIGLAAQQQSFPLLLVAGVIHGSAFALTNVPQAILGAACERRVGRTILPQFHAAFSIGAALGALAGGAASSAGLGVSAQLFTLAGIALVVRLVVAFLVGVLNASVIDESAAAPVQSEAGSRAGVLGVWAQRQTILLGAIVFAAALSEGAANNWASLALVDDLDVAESEGALAVSVFLVAQTVVRLLGGPLIDRYGRLRALQLSGGASLLGLLGFVLAPSLPLAMLGMALWGAGSALSVPIGIALAAADPHRGPARVAAVTSLSTIANIVGPPVIGILGSAWQLRAAIGSLVAAAVVAAVLAAPGATRKEQR